MKRSGRHTYPQQKRKLYPHSRKGNIGGIRKVVQQLL